MKSRGKIPMLVYFKKEYTMTARMKNGKIVQTYYFCKRKKHKND